MYFENLNGGDVDGRIILKYPVMESVCEDVDGYVIGTTGGTF
jgi:hypothetical protein